MSEALNLVQAFNTVKGILGDSNLGNCFQQKKQNKTKQEGRIAQIV